MGNPHTSEEWEALLLARLNSCGQAYEKARKEYREIHGVTVDAAGTADGVLAHQQLARASEEYRRAFEAYDRALRDFGDFVTKGKLPRTNPGIAG